MKRTALPIGLALLASLLFVPSAPAGTPYPKTGKYKGKLGDVGKVSFKVKKARYDTRELTKLIVTMSGEPDCNGPLPPDWTYGLPRNPRFYARGLGPIYEIEVLAGGVIYPNLFQLTFPSEGLYPAEVLPSGEPGYRVYLDIGLPYSKFKTERKAKGSFLILAGDDPNYDFVRTHGFALDDGVECLYPPVFGGDWSAKRR